MSRLSQVCLCLLLTSGLLLFGCKKSDTIPPNTPETPTGISSGLVGASYPYASSATDSGGGNVAIRFMWGDGDTSAWSAYVAGGSPATLSHSWAVAGLYSIIAQAEDKAGNLSDWSGGKSVYIGGQQTQYSVVLSWGAEPRDLDAHVWTPLIGSDSYHVYFGNRGYLSVAPYCSLDVDDQDGYGPEHTSFDQLSAGTYAYAVNLYTGDSALWSSHAVVEVYHQGSLLQTFNVPTTPKAANFVWWHVFDIDGATATIQSVNTFDSLPPKPWGRLDAGAGNK